MNLKPGDKLRAIMTIKGSQKKGDIYEVTEVKEWQATIKRKSRTAYVIISEIHKWFVKVKGGARPGAGRPKKSPTTIFTVRVDSDTLNKARERHGKGVHKACVEVIKELSEK